MRLWLFITTVFIFQEFVSTNAVILEAHQQHYNLWLVHIIFVLSTSLDIALGYFLGKWVQKRFKDSKLVGWAKKWANKFANLVGKKGGKFSLVLLGAANFPYVDSFVVSCLELPFKDIFVFLLIGELIWYAIEWAFVLGIKTFIPNPYYALYILIGLCILVSVAVRYASKKLFNRL